MLVDITDDPQVIAWVPTLGRNEERLRRCIESLAAQSSTSRLGVVVVINADETQTRPIAGTTTVVAGLNLGWAGGLAFARQIATAPLIWLVQDDMVTHPECLAALEARLRDDEGLAMAVPLVVDDDGRVPARSCGGVLDDEFDVIRWLPERDVDPAELAATIQVEPLSYVPSRGMLLRQTDWDAVGGMDVRFYPVLWADVDFCQALARDGRQFALVTGARVTHPGNGSSTPAYARFLHERNRRRFQQKWRDGKVDTAVDPRVPPDLMADIAVAASSALSDLSAEYSRLAASTFAGVRLDAEPLPTTSSPRSSSRTPSATSAPDSRTPAVAGSERDEEFRRIYSGMVGYAADRAELAGIDVGAAAFAEPVDTALYSLTGVPRSVILGIPDDRDFVIGAYAKIIDRLPSPAELEDATKRLSLGIITREALLGKVLGSAERRGAGVRTEILPR